MTEAGLATLLNIGSAGAVVAVVLIFLKFIKERDAESRQFFREIRAVDGEASKKLTEAIDQLVGRIVSLENKFETHDATEMEFLRGVVARMDTQAKPPRAKKQTD